MSTIRLASAVALSCMLIGCVEPPTSSARQSGGADAAAMLELYGVLEHADRGVGLVLRQNDAVIALTYADMPELEALVGSSVFVSGTLLRDGTFQVVSVRKSTDDAALALAR